MVRHVLIAPAFASRLVGAETAERSTDAQFRQAIAALPAKVRAAAAKPLKDATITGLDLTSEGDNRGHHRTVYRIAFTDRAGKAQDLAITEGGEATTTPAKEQEKR